MEAKYHIRFLFAIGQSDKGRTSACNVSFLLLDDQGEIVGKNDRTFRLLLNRPSTRAP